MKTQVAQTAVLQRRGPGRCASPRQRCCIAEVTGPGREIGLLRATPVFDTAGARGGGHPSKQIRCSIVASISACHAEDPGSIPGGGVLSSANSASRAGHALAVDHGLLALRAGKGLRTTRRMTSAIFKPARAQFVESLTVETRGYQMVPGSIPGGTHGKSKNRR
jgi:hypothetical protein